ncbi:deoxyuridine 5'-triphosphate nucleotidohydrolase, mitochondrial isoform X2 [Nannospalax galili]|uniref:deoxyuridine 5'-triphosphate nucleotidohydrolase, mitochondrial isoform X2 n=1 Tax=Nannospalax galili TaxID=1026970 RepID=UPI00111C3ADE|nr:deoxyuridine 5'-triphosphate nucleotidohydrolase, mitochondrial isoform X2 [Nannospalax galili]
MLPLGPRSVLTYRILSSLLRSGVRRSWPGVRPQHRGCGGAEVTVSPPSKQARPEEPTSRLRFVRLSEHATAPTRGSARAAGYDLYSAYDYTVPPMEKAVVKTDIQIAVPSGCYGRVAPCSGLAVKHFMDVGAKRFISLFYKCICLCFKGNVFKCQVLFLLSRNEMNFLVSVPLGFLSLK